MKEFLGDSPFRRLVDFFGNRSKSLDLKFQKKKKILKAEFFYNLLHNTIEDVLHDIY